MKKTFLLFSSVVYLGFALNAQNVGIGTITPAMALHVSKASDTALLQLENRAILNANMNVGLYFKNGVYYTGAIKTIGNSTNTSRLSFFTYSDPGQNNLVERVSILDNGNVGINTTTPSANLDVNGTFRLRGGTPAVGRILTSDAIGNASWQIPPIRNDVYTVGSMDFKAATSDNVVNVFGGTGGAYFANAVSNGNLVAPVHLPQGATVTQITFWFYDNTNENFSFEFGTERATNSSYGYGGDENTNSSGQSLNYRSANIIPSTPIVVNNNLYKYYVSAYTNWPGNFNMSIKSVIIQYTY